MWFFAKSAISAFLPSCDFSSFRCKPIKFQNVSKIFSAEHPHNDLVVDGLWIRRQRYYMDVDLIFRKIDRSPLFSDTNYAPPKLIVYHFNGTKWQPWFLTTHRYQKLNHRSNSFQSIIALVGSGFWKNWKNSKFGLLQIWLFWTLST